MAVSKYPKLWKCVGSFVKDAPSCKEEIVALSNSDQLQKVGRHRTYLCSKCEEYNAKWEAKVSLELIKALSRTI